MHKDHLNCALNVVNKYELIELLATVLLVFLEHGMYMYDRQVILSGESISWTLIFKNGNFY